MRRRRAAGADPAYDRAVREISARLFTDRVTHLAAETRRFAMPEQHEDVDCRALCGVRRPGPRHEKGGSRCRPPPPSL